MITQNIFRKLIVSLGMQCMQCAHRITVFFFFLLQTEKVGTTSHPFQNNNNKICFDCRKYENFLRFNACVSD